jgi:hypothetical protein
MSERRWKYRDRKVVHETITWQMRDGFVRRISTPRCDIFWFLEKITWTADATTCLACLATPPPRTWQGEPGLVFADWTFSNPCSEVPLK